MRKKQAILTFDYRKRKFQVISVMQRQVRVLDNLYEAYLLLQELGAPSKLILHVQLVGEVAEALIHKLKNLNISFEYELVRFGVAFHDAGKILYPDELLKKGNLHEASGEKFLIEHGISYEIARCCRSHAQWKVMDCSFEEICVALADNLWKGKRIDQLEEMFIQKLSLKARKDYWQLFTEMDSFFEMLASEADSRLIRSQLI